MKYSGDDMRHKALVLFAFALMICLVPIPVLANGNTVAYTGTAGPDSSSGDYTDTHDNLLTDYDGIKDTAGESYVILNFSIAPDNYLNSFNYSVNGAAYNDDDGNAELWVYDWTAHDWSYLDDLGQGFGAWANGSVSGSQYSGDSQITIMANSTDSDGASGVAVIIAWLHNIDSQISEWHTVGTAQLFYDVEGWNAYTAIVGFLVMFPEGVLQAWLVFLGLIMIPASTIYLVHGGRKKASLDKLFFGLVVFFIGFALLLGGIMP